MTHSKDIAQNKFYKRVAEHVPALFSLFMFLEMEDSSMHFL